MPDIHKFEREIMDFYESGGPEGVADDFALDEMFNLDSLRAEIEKHHPRLKGTIDSFVYDDAFPELPSTDDTGLGRE